MSKVVKKVFKPIKKVFKGVKNAVSKVWEKVKKPVMVAAALYLTAGVGMAAYGAATGAASGLAGSLSYGFGSVNSFLGFGASKAAAGAAGKTGAANAAGATQTVTTGSLKSQLATGLQSGKTGISFQSGLGAKAGGSAVNAAGANSGIAFKSGLGSQVGGSAVQAAGSKAATIGKGITYSSKAGGSIVNGMQPASFLQNLKQAGTNAFNGNFSKAGQNLMNAGGQAVNAAGDLYNAATANTGRALLTSNLLSAGGNYLSQRDAEKEAERARLRRTWYGMDGYGNTADGPAPEAPNAPRLKPLTIDDLINQSRGG